MIAIIPARGGSKRIPCKNIRPFLGNPIIHYPIMTAHASGLFSHIVVSTDDRLIAQVASGYGAVIHQRSEYGASDEAETEDVIAEVLEEFPSERACVMYPTSVFATPEMLIEASGDSANVVFSVTRFRGNVERALARWPDGCMSFVLPEHNGNSQDYPELYHDAGQFYFFDTARFLDSWHGGIRLLEMPNRGYIVRHCVDINDLIDWEAAEMLYRGLQL